MNNKLLYILTASVLAFASSSLYIWQKSNVRGYGETNAAKEVIYAQRNFNTCLESANSEDDCEEVSDQLDYKLMKDVRLKNVYKYCLEVMAKPQAECQGMVNQIRKLPVFDPSL